MAAATHVLRVPIRRPRAASRRPHLRAVDVAAMKRARRVRALLWTLAVVVVCSLITAVGFHVVLAQSQLELEELRSQVAAQQHEYETQRLITAYLSSPERIVSEAEAIGMVTPEEAPIAVGVPTSPATDDSITVDGPSTTLADSWAQTKPYLADQP